jgi:hypothetical protein
MQARDREHHRGDPRRHLLLLGLALLPVREPREADHPADVVAEADDLEDLVGLRLRRQVLLDPLRVAVGVVDRAALGRYADR